MFLTHFEGDVKADESLEVIDLRLNDISKSISHTLQV